MKFGIVSSAQIASSGRLDVAYNLLLAEHAELVEELVAGFTYDELVELAIKLPFDSLAANAVFPRVHGIIQSEFMKLVNPPPADRDKEPEYGPARAHQRSRLHKPLDARRRTKELACYCAAAAQFAASKVAEELLEISKQKLVVVDRLHSVLTLADSKKATNLKAALKRDNTTA